MSHVYIYVLTICRTFTFSISTCSHWYRICNEGGREKSEEKILHGPSADTVPPQRKLKIALPSTAKSSQAAVPSTRALVTFCMTTHLVTKK